MGRRPSLLPGRGRGDDVWVDLAAPEDPVGHQRQRPARAPERHPTRAGKGAVALVDHDPRCVQAFCAGLEFGACAAGGWGRGLTTLTCLANLAPRVDREERPPRSTTASPTWPPTRPASCPGSRSTRSRDWCRPGHRLAAGFASRRGPGCRGRRTVHRLRGAGGAPRRSSRTCSSRPRPITATSTAATCSTSEQGVRGAGHGGVGPGRGGADGLPHGSHPRSGWRSRTRGATRSTSLRSSRTRSSDSRRRTHRGVAWPERPVARRPHQRGRVGDRGGGVGRLQEGAAAVDVASAVSFAAATADRPLPDEQRVRATGTRRCTRSRSRTRLSRDCAACPRASCCAAPSTRRSASTSTAS